MKKVTKTVKEPKPFSVSAFLNLVDRADACIAALVWLSEAANNDKIKSETDLFEACLNERTGVGWIGWLCNMTSATTNTHERKIIRRGISSEAYDKFEQMYDEFMKRKDNYWRFEDTSEISYEQLSVHNERAAKIMRKIWYGKGRRAK